MRLQIRSLLYQCGPFLFWSAIFGVIWLVSLKEWVSLLSVPLLIIIHHGTHEASHGTLIPKTWPYWRRLNFISGCVGFALVGHNYLLMRWSHSRHHLCGRRQKNCTIDMSDLNDGLLGRVRYYALLLGVSAVGHEVAGYLYPLLPRSSNLLDRGFNTCANRRGLYILCQLYVLVATAFLVWSGGFFFLLCRITFLPFWGMGQNVAHYGLEVGQGDGSYIAARTYRVNPLLNFLFFGAGFYHAEHHAFPEMPGLLLWHPKVQQTLENRYGFELLPKHGYRNYLRDMLQQLCGPFPKLAVRDWRRFIPSTEKMPVATSLMQTNMLLFSSNVKPHALAANMRGR